MSQFLTADEIYRILQRENPPDVFPDGAPSAYFFTSDMYSAASGFANAYANLEKIWNNILPDTADEDISNWEQTLFFFPIPSLPTLAARQARAVAKLRQTRGISFWDVITFICDFIPGVWVELIVPNSSIHGSWTLDISQLDINAYLSNNQLLVWNQNVGCTVEYWILGVSALGATSGPTTLFYSQDVAQTAAIRYSYQVNIYDGGATSASTLSLLGLELSAAEPARSSHTILPGFPNPPSYATLVPNATRFSTFRYLKSDPTSTSGYTGAY